MIYRGTDSPNDFSYMGLIYTSLAKQKWFMNCVIEWWWRNNATLDGSLSKENLIEGAKGLN